MPSSTPFVDPETGLLDRYQLRREAEPLAKLVGLFAVIALTPLLVAVAVGGGPLGLLFTVLAQFAAAVGTGITLMYVVARAIALSNDETAHARVRRVPGDGRTGGRDDRTADDAGDESASSTAEPDDRSEDGDDAGSTSDVDDSGP